MRPIIKYIKNKYFPFPSSIKLQGRLGNQLFIYAFAQSFYYKTRKRMKIDDTGHPDSVPDIMQLNINQELFISHTSEQKTPIIAKFLQYLFRKNKHKHIKQNEETGNFDASLFNSPAYSYITGYFQSPRYFAPYFPLFKHEFQLATPLPVPVANLKQQIQNQKNAVFVHIRRGDYLSPKNLPLFAQLSLRYYQAALKHFLTPILPPPHFYIFSDDAEWVQTHWIPKFPLCRPYTLLTHKNPVFDFELMQSCRHAIIANSSFSWWAAYLIRSPEKIVIAPYPFHFIHNNKNLLPPDWIALDYQTGQPCPPQNIWDD